MTNTETSTLKRMTDTLNTRGWDHAVTNGRIDILGEEGETLATVSINGLGFDVDSIFSARPETCDTPDEVLDTVRAIWS